MTFPTVAWGYDGIEHDAKDMRELVAVLSGEQSGVVGGLTALKVTQQTVAAATVKVADGGFVIPATGAGLGGSFSGWNDGDQTSPSITPTGADGRKDRLIVRVTAGVPALEIVEGTASGSPAEPSITGDNYLELALITLPGSTTNITDAMITDRRVRLATGTPVICTSATRPAAPYEGMEIYETNTNKKYLYDGAAWVLIAQVGAWTSYTPTLANASTAVAKTVTYAKYRLDGKMCTVMTRVDVTGTGVTGEIRLGLPFAGVNANAAVGVFHFYDDSDTTGFAATALMGSGVAYCHGVGNASTSNLGIERALGNADVVWCSVTYEVA